MLSCSSESGSTSRRVRCAPPPGGPRSHPSGGPGGSAMSETGRSTPSPPPRPTSRVRAPMEIEGAGALVSGGASGSARRPRAGFTGGRQRRDRRPQRREGRGARGRAGRASSFVEANVTDADQVQAAVDAAAAEGGLRISVCCAGIGWAQRTISKQGPHDLEIFCNVVKVNLIGTFNVLAAGGHGDGRRTNPVTTASGASASTPPRSRRSTARSARWPTRPRRAGSSASPSRQRATSRAAACGW